MSERSELIPGRATAREPAGDGVRGRSPRETMSERSELSAGIGVAVEDWGRVSLDEVQRRAALLDRAETKYVVTTSELDVALRQLREQFDVLSIEDRIVFTYETVYFDTKDLAAYHDHAQGRRRRQKVRSRRYVDTDDSFLEVKSKGTRGRTVKERIRYDGESHGRLDDAATMFLATCAQRTNGHVDAAGDDLAGGASVDDLGPSLAMRFRRITLVGRGAPERVTIDHELQFVGPDGTKASAPRSTVIVEVKSENGRGVADGVLRAIGTRGRGCSKYCVGLNLVRNDLRYNRFKRVLVEHFGWEDRRTAAA
ncbi:MAG: polyphosphate polymerase domain-containing protein [Actinomycetota bacterium]|nr:polyphosphate polymerase domain-containing protein [Actinomycetota bacterium]